jgi:response regulator RpfG family c-di-GMP phosphodiesterase
VALWKSCSIPVILFAATIAFRPLNKKIEELHADDYVPKPFDSKILVEKIKKFIG